MAKWLYSCIDNGGKRQNIKVNAADKPSAIEKGFQMAKKKAAGDIISWNCSLIRA